MEGTKIKKPSSKVDISTLFRNDEKESFRDERQSLKKMASKIEISPPLDERKITKSPSRHEVTFSEIEKKRKK